MSVDREEDIETLTETVEIISKKWHPIIIQRLFTDGPLRFNELKDRLEGISGKVLTDSLEDLVEKEIIRREVISESPKQVQYELTADGRSLQSAMRSLASWGEQYLEPNPKILIIDDDPRLVRMYSDWLGDEYEVEKAYNGEEGLKLINDDVAVVLLDRRMPGMSGDTVLKRIRKLGIDTKVVMLTAIPPDLDIIELEFDAYIVKPGSKTEIHDVITDILTRDSYEEATEEYVIWNAKRVLLESELSPSELQADNRYQQMIARLKALETEIEDPTADLERSEQLVSAIEGSQKHDR